MKISKINIRTNTKNYSIHIGRNLINKIDKILKNSNITFEKCLVVIDKNIPSKFKKREKGLNNNLLIIYKSKK